MWPYLRIENFLSPVNAGIVRAWGKVNLPSLQSATISPPGDTIGRPDDTYRRARVGMVIPGHVWDCLEGMVGETWGLACRRLLPAFPQFGKIEKQFTVHGEGDYFRMHTDIGEVGDESYTRELSFVYYLNDGFFSGGNLRIYDTVEQEGFLHPAREYLDLPPLDNSLVVIPSSVFHEVTTVHGNGQRMTINGWFHRAAI